MLTTKRRQRRVVGETRGVGGVEISLCTGSSGIVHGGAFFFRCFRPSTSAIVSLTAFAVKSLSLRSDIRFSASCTEADDGVDTDVIRAVC